MIAKLKRKSLIILCIMMIFSVLSIETDAVSEDSTISNMSNNINCDVVFVIDASNSMQFSDPYKMSNDAFQTFVNLCNETCGIGYVVYTQNIIESKPILSLNSEKNLLEMRKNIEKIKYDPNGDTDISLGLTKALELHKKNGLQDSNRKKAIILLTDGNTHLLNGPRTVADANKELEGTLKELATYNIPVYSIGLNYDKTLKKEEIEKISSQTKGIAYEIQDSSQVADIVENIFSEVSGNKAKLIFVNEGNVPIDVKDKTLVCASVIINTRVSWDKLSPELTSPSGNKIVLEGNDKISISRTNSTAVIKLIQPDKGLWNLHLNNVDNSNCRIQRLDFYELAVEQSFDSSVVEGQSVKIKASIRNEEGVVTDDTLIHNIKFVTTISDGQEEKKITLDSYQDGYFTGEFVADKIGEYTVQTIAFYETFQRESEIQKLYVKDAIDSVILKQQLSDKQIRLGEKVKITVNTENDYASNDMALLCEIKDPEGNIENVELSKLDDNTYETEYLCNLKGRYTFVSKIKNMNDEDHSEKTSNESSLVVDRATMELLKNTAELNVRSAPLPTSDNLLLNEYIAFSPGDDVTVEIADDDICHFVYSVDQKMLSVEGVNAGSSEYQIKVKNQYGEEALIQLKVNVENAWALIFIVLGAVVLIIVIVLVAYLLLRPKMSQRIEISIIVHNNGGTVRQPSRISVYLPRKHSAALYTIIQSNTINYNALRECITALQLQGLLEGIKLVASSKKQINIRFKNNIGIASVNGQDITSGRRKFYLSDRMNNCKISAETVDIIIKKL